MEAGQRTGDDELVKQAATVFRQTGALAYLAMAQRDMPNAAAEAAATPVQRAA